MKIEKELFGLLSESGSKITFAESCTGGLASARLVNVPGSSEVFDGALCCYADGVKASLLGVERRVLDTEGAVSAACALQMARGAAALFGADTALSITGFAGPGGGTERRPVGTVYICCLCRGKAETRRFRFSGGRREVRRKAADAALRLAAEALRKRKSGD